MLPESDIQRLVVEGRQRLVQEFADTYVNLRERVKRVPDTDARKVSEGLSCPLEIAMIAYLINMDGILTLRNAVDLFTSELERRANVGDSVPNLPGNIMEFSLIEGRWISYLHGKFVHQLELQIRSLSNLEDAIDDNNISVERALSIIAERTKIAETFISPIVDEWQKEHIKSTSADAAIAFGQAITKWNRSTLNGKFNQVLKRNQAFFRLLRKALTKTSESFTIDATIERVSKLIQELERPLEELTPRALSHFLLHLTPLPQGRRGDRSPFVDIGVSSTRSNKAEPDLSSPFDFLERDIKLAKRRKDDDRKEYLIEKIGRVLRVLKYQGNDIMTGVAQCYREIQDRFSFDDESLPDEIEQARLRLIDAVVSERDNLAINLVYEFIAEKLYEVEA